MRRLVLILMLAGQALAQSQISRIILLICSGSSPPDGFRAQVRPVRSRMCAGAAEAAGGSANSIWRRSTATGRTPG